MQSLVEALVLGFGVAIKLDLGVCMRMREKLVVADGGLDIG